MSDRGSLTRVLERSNENEDQEMERSDSDERSITDEDSEDQGESASEVASDDGEGFDEEPREEEAYIADVIAEDLNFAIRRNIAKELGKMGLASMSDAERYEAERRVAALELDKFRASKLTGNTIVYYDDVPDQPDIGMKMKPSFSKLFPEPRELKEEENQPELGYQEKVEVVRGHLRPTAQSKAEGMREETFLNFPFETRRKLVPIETREIADDPLKMYRTSDTQNRWKIKIDNKKIEIDQRLREIEEIKHEVVEIDYDTRMESIEERLRDLQSMEVADFKEKAKNDYPEDVDWKERLNQERESLVEARIDFWKNETDLEIAKLKEEIVELEKKNIRASRQRKIKDPESFSLLGVQYISEDLKRYEALKLKANDLKKLAKMEPLSLDLKALKAKAEAIDDLAFLKNFDYSRAKANMEDRTQIKEALAELSKDFQELLKNEDQSQREEGFAEIQERLSGLLYDTTIDLTEKEERKVARLKKEIKELRREILEIEKEKEDFFTPVISSDYVSGLPEAVGVSHVKVENWTPVVGMLKKNRVVVTNYQKLDDGSWILKYPGDPKEHQVPAKDFKLVENTSNPHEERASIGRIVVTKLPSALSSLVFETSSEKIGISEGVFSKPEKFTFLAVVTAFTEVDVTLTPLLSCTSKVTKGRIKKLDKKIKKGAASEPVMEVLQKMKADLQQTLLTVEALKKSRYITPKSKKILEEIKSVEGDLPSVKKLVEATKAKGKIVLKEEKLAFAISQLRDLTETGSFKMPYQTLWKSIGPKIVSAPLKKSVLDRPITKEQVDYLTETYYQALRGILNSPPKESGKSETVASPPLALEDQPAFKQELYSEWVKRCRARLPSNLKGIKKLSASSVQLSTRLEDLAEEDELFTPDDYLALIIENVKMPDGTSALQGLDIDSPAYTELELLVRNLRLAKIPAAAPGVVARFRTKLIKALGSSEYPTIAQLLQETVNEETRYRRGLQGVYGRGLDMQARAVKLYDTILSGCIASYHDNTTEVQKWKKEKLADPKWMQRAKKRISIKERKIAEELEEIKKLEAEERAKIPVEYPEEAVPKKSWSDQKLKEEVKVMIDQVCRGIKTLRGLASKLVLLYLVFFSPIAKKFEYFRQALRIGSLEVMALGTAEMKILAPELYLGLLGSDKKERKKVDDDLKLLTGAYINRLEFILSKAEEKPKSKNFSVYPHAIDAKLISVAEACKDSKRMMSVNEVIKQAIKSGKVLKKQELMKSKMKDFELKENIPKEDLLLEIESDGTFVCTSIRDVLSNHYLKRAKVAPAHKPIIDNFEKPKQMDVYKSLGEGKKSLEEAVNYVMEIYHQKMGPKKEEVLEAPKKEEVRPELPINRELRRIFVPSEGYVNSYYPESEITELLMWAPIDELFGEERHYIFTSNATASPDVIVCPLNSEWSDEKKLDAINLGGKYPAVLAKARYLLPLAVGENIELESLKEVLGDHRLARRILSPEGEFIYHSSGKWLESDVVKRVVDADLGSFKALDGEPSFKKGQDIMTSIQAFLVSGFGRNLALQVKAAKESGGALSSNLIEEVANQYITYGSQEEFPPLEDETLDESTLKFVHSREVLDYFSQLVADHIFSVPYISPKSIEEIGEEPFLFGSQVSLFKKVIATTKEDQRSLLIFLRNLEPEDRDEYLANLSLPPSMRKKDFVLKYASKPSGWLKIFNRIMLMEEEDIDKIQQALGYIPPPGKPKQIRKNFEYAFKTVYNSLTSSQKKKLLKKGKKANAEGLIELLSSEEKADDTQWKKVAAWIREVLLKQNASKRSEYYAKLGYRREDFDTPREQKEEYERLFFKKFSALGRAQKLEIIEMSERAGRTDILIKKVFDLLFSS